MAMALYYFQTCVHELVLQIKALVLGLKTTKLGAGSFFGLKHWKIVQKENLLFCYQGFLLLSVTYDLVHYVSVLVPGKAGTLTQCALAILSVQGTVRVEAKRLQGLFTDAECDTV